MASRMYALYNIVQTWPTYDGDGLRLGEVYKEVENDVYYSFERRAHDVTPGHISERSAESRGPEIGNISGPTATGVSCVLK